MTVSAVHEPDKGDYESILKVDQISTDSVGYTVSANVDDRRYTVREAGLELRLRGRGKKFRRRQRPARKAREVHSSLEIEDSVDPHAH
jgi:hypothetical protein